jgi:hypothetical protein
MTNSINPVLEKYIATRDKKIMASSSIEFTPPLNDYFQELLTKGSVIVGGRASCGSGADPTWKKFTAWNEVVRKAQKLGYSITVKNRLQKNGSPTRSGGFWNENEYVLEATHEHD